VRKTTRDQKAKTLERVTQVTHMFFSSVNVWSECIPHRCRVRRINPGNTVVTNEQIATRGVVSITIDWFIGTQNTKAIQTFVVTKTHTVTPLLRYFGDQKSFW